MANRCEDYRVTNEWVEVRIIGGLEVALCDMNQGIEKIWGLFRKTEYGHFLS